jgi:fatty acid desaturase
MSTTSEVLAMRTLLPGSPHLTELTTEDGTSWREYRKTLRPYYSVVWRDVALCHVMIAAGYGLAVFCESNWTPIWAVAWLPPVALWIAFWLHALLGFGHESAHDNVAPGRKWNDRLANVFVWSFFGQSAAQYRRVHWQHHLHLGDPNDTEISYHQCLRPMFVLKLLSGWHLVVTFVRHLRAGAVINQGGREELFVGSSNRRKRAERWPIVVSLFVHAALTMLPWALGFPLTALTWCVAVLVFFPCATTVRQLVEHRKFKARCQQDFRHEVHGAVNRMFGTGFVARYFGSAGFNRHLLHHWDPAISYTRFDEMEGFLLRTTIAEELESHRTGYVSTMCRLVKDAIRG